MVGVSVTVGEGVIVGVSVGVGVAVGVGVEVEVEVGVGVSVGVGVGVAKKALTVWQPVVARASAARLTRRVERRVVMRRNPAEGSTAAAF
jgi:hypothetical protein